MKTGLFKGEHIIWVKTATQAGKDVPIKLEANYKARVANLILDTLKLRHERLTMLNFAQLYFIFRPLTKSLGEVGFLHTDLWSNNLLKKDNNIIAIDFETAITGNLTICVVIIVVLIVMSLKLCPNSDKSFLILHAFWERSPSILRALSNTEKHLARSLQFSFDLNFPSLSVQSLKGPAFVDLSSSFYIFRS